ncbi:hypothetical protein ACFL3S_02655 [Gemmatimonadota bacterium]
MKCIDRWVRGVTVVLCLLPNACIVGVVDFDDDDHHSGDREASKEFYRVVTADGQNFFRIVGGNGTVEIEGSEGAQEVTISATLRVRSDTRGDAEDHLRLLDVSVTSDPTKILVETVQPQNPGGRTYIVDYEIEVPALWLVEVTNGNGSIRLEDLDGDVEIRNGNGDITLSGITGSSWLVLGNGVVDAQIWLPVDGQIVHSLGNGSLKLRVQPDVSAELNAKIGNGPIVLSGFTLHEAVSGPGILRGTLGGGQGLIDLTVGNGTIEVKEH